MKSLLIFILLFTLNAYETMKTMGPVGKIIVNSIFPCDEKVQMDGVDLNLAVKSIDSKGTKALFGNLTNKIPIDASVTYNADIKKWENSQWITKLTHKGKFCDDVKKFAPDLWKKLMVAMKPSPDQPCLVKEGSYTVEKFHAESKDFNIPSIFYGRMFVKFVVSKGGKSIVCISGEGDSRAPV